MVAEWCAWCDRLLRGKKSFDLGVCYKCRKTDDFKKLEEEKNKK